MGCKPTKFDRVNPQPSFRPSSYYGGDGIQNFYNSSKKWASRRSSSSKSEAVYAIPSRAGSIKSDCRDEMCRLIQDLLNSYCQTIRICPSTKLQCERLDKLIEQLNDNNLTEEQYLIFLHYIKEEFVKLLSIAAPIDHDEGDKAYTSVFPMFIATQQVEMKEAGFTAPSTFEETNQSAVFRSAKLDELRTIPEKPRCRNNQPIAIAQELLSILPL